MVVRGKICSRIRIPAGGHNIECIESYNRVHDKTRVFSATYSKHNYYAYGFVDPLGGGGGATGCDRTVLNRITPHSA